MVCRGRARRSFTPVHTGVKRGPLVSQPARRLRTKASGHTSREAGSKTAWVQVGGEIRASARCTRGSRGEAHLLSPRTPLPPLPRALLFVSARPSPRLPRTARAADRFLGLSSRPAPRPTPPRRRAGPDGQRGLSPHGPPAGGRRMLGRPRMAGRGASLMAPLAPRSTPPRPATHWQASPGERPHWVRAPAAFARPGAARPSRRTSIFMFLFQ